MIADYDNAPRFLKRFEPDDVDLVLTEYYFSDVKGLDLIEKINKHNVSTGVMFHVKH